VIPLLRENENQVAFEYLKKNPNRGYFPWNPLATLMADGKFSTVEDALGIERDHTVSGAHLPESPEFIAYPPGYYSPWGKYRALDYYPEYKKDGEIQGLPKFIIFKK
jgi:hypothetical protein